jgi:RimJ/RimL family protein N-acetyltransferase
MTAMVVRRLEERDLDARVRWFNDPSVYGQMSLKVPLSLADTRRWFAQNALNDQRRDFVILAAGDPDGEPVAMGGLTGIVADARHAELYSVVRPGCTGRGTGGFVVRWLCNYGFLQLGLQRIYLHTLSNNDRARRLYERIGFAPEGVLRRHVWHNGRIVDRHVHGLLREEWEAQPWSTDATGLEDTV